MRIIQVQTQAEAAGAQRVSDMVGDGLRAAGHEVRTVFMYRKTDAYDGDPYADFVSRDEPANGWERLKAALGLIGYLRRERPDAVLCYQYYGVAFGVIGARLAGARIIIANQSGQPMKKGMLGVMSLIDKIYGTLGLYDYSITNSAWTHAQYGDYPSAYRARLQRIDHGVLAPHGAMRKDVARQKFGLPVDVPLAISSGRVTADKNQIALVRALAHSPRFHIAIAGVGPALEELKQTAESQGTADRLHLIGEVPKDEIFDFLAAGDLYVFPTRFETFGLAAAEAAISGLPIVANDLPVLREVLSDTTGRSAALFVDCEDSAAIAQAVEAVLDEPDVAQNLSAAGRGMGQRYAPQVMCDAYAALLGPKTNDA